MYAASAQKAYNFATKADLPAQGVADFLVLSHQFPRSIRFNVNFLYQTLRQLEQHYDQRSDCHDLVADVAWRINGLRIEHIIASGLHEFLTETVEQNYAVSDALSVSYGFGGPPASAVDNDANGQ